MARDIILITVDALRADYVGVVSEGETATRTIDTKFHPEKALVATQAFASGPYTRGAFPGIMTGCHSYGNRPEAFDERPNIAAGLKNSGYTTAGVHSNPHLAGGSGFERGYGHFDDGMGGSRLVQKLRRFVGQVRGTYEPYQSAKETTRRAIAWFERHTEAAPRFLWVHYMDPHAPYRPRPGTRSEPIGNRTSQRLWDAVQKEDATALDNEQLSTLEKLYYGEVEYFDDALDRLLTAVDRHADNPIIAILADHGELLGEEGYLGHPGILHESLLRVPFAVSGIESAGRVSTPVSGIDLLPTLYEAAGIKVPDGCQGIPLQSAMTDETRIVFAQSGVPGENLSVAGINRQYIYTRTPDTGEQRLYSRDSGQVEPHERVPAALKRAVNLHIASIDKPDTASETPVSSEVQQRLNDLGYT
jgi:arylsulfatase